MASDPAASKPRKSWQVSLRAVLVIVALVCLFVATEGFGLIGLHYPRAIDNDPLVSPVTVTLVAPNVLQLEDGRRLEVAFQDLGVALDKAISDSDGKIDMEVGNNGVVSVYLKRRSWVCGTPWARAINIPLIPDDVPLNRRQLVGTGRFQEATAMRP